MSTAYMAPEQIVLLCTRLSLNLRAVVGSDPAEYRVLNDYDVMLFQGSADRVSDFLNGYWRALDHIGRLPIGGSRS